MNIDIAKSSLSGFSTLEYPKDESQCQGSHLQWNRSLSMIRKPSEGWSTICTNSEPSFEPDSLEISAQMKKVSLMSLDDSMRRSLEVPERFIKGCASQSQSCEKRLQELEVKDLELSKLQTSENVRRAKFRSFEKTKDKVGYETDFVVFNADKSAGGDPRTALMRRNSYKEAVDNYVVSSEDTEICDMPRPRSHSFKAALETGQLSPSSISSQSSISSSGRQENTHPDCESSGSILSYPPKPKYASTPLPTSSIRLDKGSVEREGQHNSIVDIEEPLRIGMDSGIDHEGVRLNK